MGKVKILIVDDEERIREMIKEYVSLEAYAVEEASDGDEALNLFRQNSYSLIILDVMMPKMDGWIVCREIRKTSQVPVIMLTARGEEYDKLFGFELGVDDYVVKPFSPKELLTPKEYELINFFVHNPNRVFSRDQLLNSVWGYDFIGDHRTVDTHIKMLRESLGIYRKFIVTVWGTGYKFEAGAAK